MECYACDQEAIERCSRCGNPYCAAHGDASPAAGAQPFCGECLDPVNATPSGVAFRASLFGLLIASVLALWLLIRPPSLPGESSGAVRPLPVVSPSAAAATSPPEATDTATSAPEVTAPPTEATPAPTEAPPAGPIQYTIQDGDTISGIATAHGISFPTLLEFNGLTEEEASVLQPGDVISIPQ
jgi:LysM repeat protein